MEEELKIIISAEVAKLKKGVKEAKDSLSDFKKESEKQQKQLKPLLDKMGNDFSALSKKIGQVAIAGATAAATAVGALFKNSFENYAEYEQLVGGAQLLYGDAYDYIASKSKEAYKTVQMSANDYLTQVNGFATGLKTSLGGNEKAAAELADKIITAEADIVAATGNTQENIQNAFNGIMKGNYTMLDNLQIGIKPTKEGFQEVIDKVNDYNASIGKASNYTIDNLADCEAALVDYVGMVGMSGYAAEEASGTIQGSIASAKAAYSNWVAGLMDDNADIGELTTDLIDSVASVVENVIPRIGEFTENLTTGVHDALEDYPELQSAFDSVVSAAQTMFNIVSDVVSFVVDNWAIIEPILVGLAAVIGTITVALGIYNAVMAVKEAMDVAQVTTLGALAAATWTALAPYLLIAAAIAAVIAIIVICIKHWDEIKEKVIEVATKIRDKVVELKDKVVNKFTEIKDGITEKVEALKSKIQEKFNAIKEKITKPVEDAKAKVKEIIEKIKGFFKFEWSLPKLKMPHVKIDGEFSLLPPKVPKFSIDWYAKGGVFDNPTLFSNGGRLSGLGEAGAEAVVPLENNTEWLDKIAERLGGNDKPATFIFKVGETEFGRASVNSINALTRQTGRLELQLI